MTRLIAILLLTTATTANAQSTPPRQQTDPLAALLVKGRGLTSDEAARRAAETSVDARMRDRAVDAAEASRQEAEAGYLPRLMGTARYTRLSHAAPPTFGDPNYRLVATSSAAGTVPAPDTLVTSPDLSFPVPENQYLLQATLTVPLSDYVLRVSRAIAAATHSERAARIDGQAARLNAAAHARVDYYTWILARGRTLAATQSLEQARGHLRDAQQMFAAGVLSQADTLRAESQVKEMELFVMRSDNAAAQAEEQLRVAMHDPGSLRYEVGEDIVAALPPPPGEAEVAKLLDAALDKRLELRALDETAGSVKELARIARAAIYPRLDVQGNATYANPNPRIFPQTPKYTGTWDASVVLSWAPTDIPAARAAERQRTAEAARIAAQRDALLDGLRLEVTTYWRRAREAEVALGTATQKLRASEEGYRVRDNLFRNGKATLVEVNDAETDLLNARLEIINAHVEARVARALLAHAVGDDVVAAK